jgi:hypothetical protein
LLDRAVLICLPHIPEEKRKEERAILEDFDKFKAAILGGFLDVLVKAMQLYPSVRPKKLFRMADFTRWGAAIATALGRTAEQFIGAYSEKILMQTEEVAHTDVVAIVLLDWIRERKADWEGTPTELFMILKGHAKTLDISTHQKAWPKAPSSIIKRLNELSPSLKALAVEVVTGIKSGGIRKIRVLAVPSDPSVHNVQGNIVGNDGLDSRDTILHYLQGEVPKKEEQELAINSLRKLCQNKPLVHIQEIVADTSLQKDEVIQILGNLQLQGKASQPRPDMWVLLI